MNRWGPMHRYFIFLTVPLILSGFTHLWNPIGFPEPNIDEGLYLGRAINLIDSLNPKDPYIGYDHPYFGQIFLAAILLITGYQNLFAPTGYLNFELLLVIPRIVMGVLAVLDTFLIFKIVESRYNTMSAFIASILFAVMPITWLTRWILLDSIQLPFILSSILFALMSGSRMSAITKRGMLLVLLSGVFLGLSIFTKIPAFTMIPLTGYLIYSHNNKSLKVLLLWLVPIILIPALWPLHAIAMDEFSEWWTSIYNQTHRESHSLFVALGDFFIIDPILLIIAVPGLIYAAIKRDLFILLSQMPFLIFMYFIGYVIVFHLLLFALFSCISSAKLFVDTLSFARKKRIVLLSSIAGIVAIGLVGFSGTTEQIIADKNSQIFQAARFVDQYLKTVSINDKGYNEKKDESITRVSSPFFFWADKYKFQDENSYYWNVDSFQTEKIIFIIDNGQFGFGSVLNQDSVDGRIFKNLFSVFDTHRLIAFRNDSLPDSIGVDILLTDLRVFNKNKINATDILVEESEWTHSKYTQIQKGNGIVNITVDTSNAKKKDNVNRAFVDSIVNLNGTQSYIFLSYSTFAHGNDTKFTIELNDIENHKLWSHQLRKTQSTKGTAFFILPETVTENRVGLSLMISSHERGTDSLILHSLNLYH